MDVADTDRWNAFVVEAARLVVDDERAVERIHARHVAGRDGDCTCCGRGASWPCVHHSIADRVVRLRRERAAAAEHLTRMIRSPAPPASR